MRLTIDRVDMNIPGNPRRYAPDIRREGLICALLAAAFLIVALVCAWLVLNFEHGRAFLVGLVANAIAVGVYVVKTIRCFRAVAPRWPCAPEIGDEQTPRSPS